MEEKHPSSESEMVEPITRACTVAFGSGQLFVLLGVALNGAGRTEVDSTRSVLGEVDWSLESHGCGDVRNRCLALSAPFSRFKIGRRPRVNSEPLFYLKGKFIRLATTSVVGHHLCCPGGLYVLECSFKVGMVRERNPECIFSVLNDWIVGCAKARCELDNRHTVNVHRSSVLKSEKPDVAPMSEYFCTVL